MSGTSDNFDKNSFFANGGALIAIDEQGERKEKRIATTTVTNWLTLASRLWRCAQRSLTAESLGVIPYEMLPKRPRQDPIDR